MNQTANMQGFLPSWRRQRTEALSMTVLVQTLPEDLDSLPAGGKRDQLEYCEFLKEGKLSEEVKRQKQNPDLEVSVGMYDLLPGCHTGGGGGGGGGRWGDAEGKDGYLRW